jgi:hypothetical protein
MFRPLGHLQVGSKIIRGKYRVQPLVLHIINKGGAGTRSRLTAIVGVCLCGPNMGLCWLRSCDRLVYQHGVCRIYTLHLYRY